MKNQVTRDGRVEVSKTGGDGGEEAVLNRVDGCRHIGDGHGGQVDGASAANVDATDSDLDAALSAGRIHGKDFTGCKVLKAAW